MQATKIKRDLNRRKAKNQEQMEAKRELERWVALDRKLVFDLN